MVRATRDEYNKIRRDRRHANREEFNRKAREYRNKNKDRINLYFIKYNKKHKIQKRVSSKKTRERDFGLFKTYCGMVNRCHSTNYIAYKNYSGRGIKCLWTSYKEFKIDMYKSYLEHIKIHTRFNTQLDRIDNDGNYSKENCRWATRKEQANNTRQNVYLTYNGKTKTITQWSDELKIKKCTIKSRIRKNLSIEKILCTKHLQSINLRLQNN